MTDITKCTDGKCPSRKTSRGAKGIFFSLVPMQVTMRARKNHED